mgnify:CR=1 FL=1
MGATRQAALKILDRIETANRLGGLFRAEAAGMLRALSQLPPADPPIYADHGQQAAYLRGYRDAQEIIAVEGTLAARMSAAPVAQQAARR